jgi:hypothetical protein
MQMDRDEIRKIEWDCSKLVNEFYCALDEKRYEDMANLFAPEGIWNRLGVDLKGPQQILSSMEMRSDWLTAHLVTNTRVRVLLSNHAETTQYITLYRHEGWAPEHGPASVVLPLGVLKHWDSHVKVGSEWKIAKKVSQAIMIDRSRVSKYNKK